MCLGKPAPPDPSRRETRPRDVSRGRQPQWGSDLAHLYLSLSLCRAVKVHSVRQGPDHVAPQTAGVRGTGPSRWATAALPLLRTPRKAPAPRPHPGLAPWLFWCAPRCLGIRAPPPARPQVYGPLRARTHSPQSPAPPGARISDGTTIRHRSASSGLTRAQIPSPRSAPSGFPPASSGLLTRTSWFPLPAPSPHRPPPGFRYPQDVSPAAACPAAGPLRSEGIAGGERDPPVSSTSGGPNPGTARGPFLI